jgi:phosphatidylethanolamine/phosphatidyl-N-methylethanolamine N-methyltransferase
MELAAVRKSYARWAPVYDATFGLVTERGRRQAARYINRRGGSVLEVGVGTGLALPNYGPSCDVTGIDYSAEMLAKARVKVRTLGLLPVRDLRQMDARHLDFPDAAFDTVTAMHVMSVVPEPERVMAEMARVLRPGGEIVITCHFARAKGLLSVIERVLAPLQDVLGWHSDFERHRLMGEPSLSVVCEHSLPPLGIMTFLVLRKAG